MWLAQGAVGFAAVAPLFVGAVSYFFYAFFRGLSIAQTGYETDPNAVVRPIWNAVGVLVAVMAPIALISTYFVTGMARTAMKQVRGEPIGLADLFSGGGGVYLKALGAALLSTAAGFLPLSFVIVPALLASRGAALGVVFGTAAALAPLVPAGVLLSGRLLLVHPLAAEAGLGLTAAVRESWRITGPHQWAYLAWGLLIYLTAGSGLLIGIGTIGSVPLAILMLMAGYRAQLQTQANCKPMPGSSNMPAAAPQGMSSDAV